MNSNPNPQDVAATFCATLVDEWVSQGVVQAVISPGSRSTPMALALHRNPGIRVNVAHDERVGGFMALGIGLESRRPAVVLCTSGTAASHFHAAVLEADLAGVPMIVCTADRPPELVGVKAPQTINQTNLYGGAIRWFCDRGVPQWEDRDNWRKVARESVQRSTGINRGPVHLNLPFREPLIGATLQLPIADKSSEVFVEEVAVDVTSINKIVEQSSVSDGVIVAGSGCEGSKEVMHLGASLGWPIIACPRSGLASGDGVVRHADSILRVEDFARKHKPQMVIQFGEAVASKVVNQYLHEAGAFVVQISDRQEHRDPYLDVNMFLVGNIADYARVIVRTIGERSIKGPEKFEMWSRAERVAMQAINDAVDVDRITEASVAYDLVANTISGSTIVASSSMPIRDIEWFAPARNDVRILSNRGANGIDGVVSTSIGVAESSGLPTYVLVGDVAFLHDSSALIALAQREIDLRIVVVDNDGGGIFSFLSQGSQLPKEEFELLFGTPHGTDIAALALAHRIKVLRVESRKTFVEAMATPGPVVIYVASDRRDNVAEHSKLNAAVAKAIMSE